MPKIYTLQEFLTLTEQDYSGRRFSGKWLFKEWNEDSGLSIQKWRDIFVECEDLTEYQGAIALGFTWPQWKVFKSDWMEFRDEIIPSWLEEIEIRLRSKGLKEIIKRVSSDTTPASAKWLAEAKWKEPVTAKKAKAKQKEITDKVVNTLDDAELDRVFNAVSQPRAQ